jgi:hypothetical protein
VADPLRVWLVEHNNPFADAGQGEAAQVRSGVQAALKKWLAKVVKHSAATAARPAGFKDDVEVQWSDVKDPSKVGDRDLVVYFSPLPPAGTTATKSVIAGPYKDALSPLPNRDLVRELLADIAKPAAHRGKTLRPAVVYPTAVQRIQAVSEVFVLYDAQFSIASLRVQGNVDTLTTAAFHECAHNKYEPADAGGEDRVHQDGGGGVFAAQYVGQALKDDNIKFLAGYIWNWGPQYLRGQPLSLMRVP